MMLAFIEEVVLRVANMRGSTLKQSMLVAIP
jgi:hypothetical protein